MSLVPGTAPRFTASFTDADGAAADPTGVVVKVRDPSGDQTTYTHPHATITNPAVGTWVWQAPAGWTEKGKWWVRFAGTGNGVTVALESSEEVCASHLVLT